MPIRIKDSMPVAQKLESENIFIIPENKAIHQDIRPLQIAVVNIMPVKQTTELQLLRLLSNSPLQTDVTFIRLVTHTYKNISYGYLESNYTTFENIRNKHFDGLIITGAPVENLEYEKVDYWNELVEIMEWSKTNVTSTLHICWAAQAGLYYHYKIPKYTLPQKLSGIYPHRILRKSAKLIRGFDDIFYAPHSRYTGIKTEDIKKAAKLEILAESDEAGAYIIFTRKGKQIFINGHPEYDTLTLDSEYHRDINRNLNPEIPKNYYPQNNPENPPVANWRCHSNLLFANWLNYFVYQITPYDIEKCGSNTEL